ncbi:hypothetical protein [Streptomyces antibioticus]|uniref:Uncharacterized protein n=1 Tax=Streptomyces antibioticus TaxID=1890 RepID=A0AAE7CJJ2_STRAT|nr:hypothetical protein [Streptomyces antibioticus]MCX4740188.1 hypothetical protein [Streptomyces antibioticus]MCX5168028.1 hypothetical protein [Streptomyces antibioticus]QIT43580.1 hypothetical protein HCX60_08655 [Streptomyces antibioticus]
MITFVIAFVTAFMTAFMTVFVIVFVIAGERFDDRNAIARSPSVHRR